jgi:hypothetical protein
VFCYNLSIVSQEVARTAVVADRSPGIAVLPAGANCTVSLLVVGRRVNSVVTQVLAFFTVSAERSSVTSVLSTGANRAVHLLIVESTISPVVSEVLPRYAASAVYLLIVKACVGRQVYQVRSAGAKIAGKGACDSSELSSGAYDAVLFAVVVEHIKCIVFEKLPHSTLNANRRRGFNGVLAVRTYYAI